MPAEIAIISKHLNDDELCGYYYFLASALHELIFQWLLESVSK